MKQLQKSLLFLTFLFLFSTSIEATNKIYTTGCSLVIVADDSQWDCVKYYYEKKVTGTHKDLPIKFHFSKTWVNNKDGKYEYLNQTLSFLDSQAKETSTVFSNIHIKRKTESFFYFVGNYLDNESLGYFAYYLFQNLDGVSECWYSMLVKVEDYSLDDFNAESAFDETFALITSLVTMRN